MDGAAAAAAECLEWCDRAHGPTAATDLCQVSALLVEAGHPVDAFSLIGRVVDELRAAGAGELGQALTERGRQMLVRGEPVEAAAVLREARDRTSRGRYAGADIHVRRLLLIALGRAGEFDELNRMIGEDLGLFAILAWLSLAERRRYVGLLAELAGAQDRAGPSWQGRDMRALLEKQREVLRRKLTRRRRLQGRVARLVLRAFGDRGRPPVEPATAYADVLAAQAVRLEAAVTAEAADVAQHRRSGDTPALAEALAVLAEARWRTGGQRSAALTAQREAVELTRKLVQHDPAQSAALLVERLRRFAELADTIGLRTDAQAARAEATAVQANPSYQP
ncbi:MAG TPA: hypothetical protein VGJ07_13235 [Rugosimonospora sp.]